MAQSFFKPMNYESENLYNDTYMRVDFFYRDKTPVCAVSDANERSLVNVGHRAHDAFNVLLSAEEISEKMLHDLMFVEDATV